MPLVTIDNTNTLKRYDFTGTALPTEWNILEQGSGQTVSVANSILTIAAGTTAGAQTIIRCTQRIRVKAYVRFIMQLSQRIANQNIYLELTNEAGTTFARYDFNGTTATSAQCQTGNQGTNNAATAATVPTTANYATFDIYADTNDVVFSSVAANSNALKGGVVSFDRNILDPNEDYFVQIRVLNGGTAPASNTNINVDAVVIQDLTGVKVDVIRGDGTSALANTQPVNVLAMPTTTVQPTISTSFGASTHFHLISAATTNATLVKSSVGVISTIEASNNGASPRYLKLYNMTTAPTVGTSTPVKTIMIPAGGTVTVPAGPAGMRFWSGISIAITGGIAVADTTAINANEVAVNISYT
jgi:hypothetical protein